MTPPHQSEAEVEVTLWSRVQGVLETTRRSIATWKVTRILTEAIKRFLADDCLIRANGIAYSIVFSIIPLLAVLVRFADVDKHVIQANLARFMAAYGMDATEILPILGEIIERARQVFGIGAIIIIFSATNLLSHLEDAFNYIYRAATSRPLFYRFSIYISSLVVLPGVLILSTGVLRNLTSVLQPTEYLHMARAGSRVWLAADDGKPRVLDGGKITAIDLTKRLDRNATFREQIIEIETGRVGKLHKLAPGLELSIRLDAGDIRAIHRVAARGRGLFFLSRAGALFHSFNGGQSWDYTLFRFKDVEIRRGIMEDIYIRKDGRVMILATLGARSFLLEGEPGKPWSFQPLGAVFSSIVALRSQDSTKADPRDGLYLTGNGGYLYSTDGKVWAFFEARFGKRSPQLSVLTRAPDEGLIVGGTWGSLFRVGNGPKLASLRGRAREALQGLHMGEHGHGFIYGRDGFFRYTPDGGKRWLQAESGLLGRAYFNCHLIMPDGSALFAGERETLLRIAQPRATKQLDPMGYPLFTAKRTFYRRYPLLMSAFMQFVLFILLYALVLGIFVVGYRVLPNAPVDWAPAAIGGAITATALVIFVMGFRMWLVNFSSTTVLIYGAWAIIPVGMLIILTSTQIILFGLELAYVLQHPYLYESNRKTQSLNQEEYGFWNALLLVSLVYNTMYRDKRPLDDKSALPYFQNDLALLEQTRRRLVDQALFNYDVTTGHYYPVRPPSEIGVAEIQEIAMRHTFDVPPQARGGAYRARFLEINHKVKEKMKIGAGKTTVAEMLPLLGKVRAR